MRPVLTLLTAAALLGGCGTSDRDAVTAVVEGYFDDLGARDWAGACSALAPEYQRTIDAFARATYPDLQDRRCAAVLARTAGDADGSLIGSQARLEVGEVTVTDDRATAVIGPDRQARLVQRDGDWLIADLDLG